MPHVRRAPLLQQDIAADAQVDQSDQGKIESARYVCRARVEPV
jgi:hypothetical protein